MNGDDFNRLYPAEPVKPVKAKPKPMKVNIANIGQILLICFLFIMILLQTAKIISEPDIFAGNEAGFDLRDNDSPDPNANLQKSDGNINVNANIDDGKNPAYRNGGDSKNHENININNNQNDENSETILILGECNGKLAVLSPDGRTVYETFDVYINTLPDYDKNLLQNGIEIKTTEQLYALLEAYNS